MTDKPDLSRVAFVHPAPGDGEDVTWALQTAETLWTRGEPLDALVWVRRAAQTAADDGDNARASSLEAEAERIAEEIGAKRSQPPPSLAKPAAPNPLDPFVAAKPPSTFPRPASQPPARFPGAPAPKAPPPLPGLRAAPPLPGAPAPKAPPPLPGLRAAPPLPGAPAPKAPPPLPGLRGGPPPVPRGAPPLPGARPPVAPLGGRSPLPGGAAPPALRRLEPAAPPPVAEEVAPDSERTPPSLSAPPHGAATPAEGVPSLGTPLSLRDDLVEVVDSDDAVTPPPPHASAPLVEEEPAAEITVDEPLVEEPAAEITVDEPLVEDEPAAEISVDEPLVEEEPAAEIPVDEPVVEDEPAAEVPEDAAAAEPEAPAHEAPDLTGADALSDLPDDVRDELATRAGVVTLAEGESVPLGALGYVIEGAGYITADAAEAVIHTLGAGEVLLGYGTVEPSNSLRIYAAEGGATVAVWEAGAVTAALAPCSWVEDELREKADPIQARAGLTAGPLAARVDAGLLAPFLDELTIRSFGPGEAVVQAGERVPGLLILAAGAISSPLAIGDVLLGEQVLGGGKSPETITAGEGGASFLAADRMKTQELLATAPFLVELLAGM